jgi:hemerythrin-like domain-containing protein
MNPIELLKQEHIELEQELKELEEIMNSEEINYPNLVHVMKKLYYFWNSHEDKEEKLFPILKKEKLEEPFKKMSFEHKQLKPHKEKIYNTINSGNNEEIKKVLEKHGKIIIEKMRKHINDEDEVLYTITLQEFTPDELISLWASVSS